MNAIQRYWILTTFLFASSVIIDHRYVRNDTGIQFHKCLLNPNQIILDKLPI